MKIRKRHRKPRKVEGTGCDAASRPDHFDGAPFFSLAPGCITFPSDAAPVLRAPFEIERGEDEVWTPDGWVRTDGFDVSAASEGGAQQDTDPPGGRPEDYRDIDEVEGA